MTTYISVLMLLFLLPWSMAVAQEDFVNGSIEMRDGSLIKAEIAQIDPVPSDIICHAKLANETTARSFSPDQIRSFEFEDGRRFLSNQLKFKVDTLNSQFVEQLVAGPANLYFSRGSFYMMKLDSVPVMISWLEAKSSNNTLKKDLNFMISDCPKAGTRLSMKNYNHENLIAVIKNYNSKCYSLSKTVLYPYTYVKKSFLELSAAAVSARVKAPLGPTMNTFPAYSFGLSYRHSLPSANNKWALNYSLSLHLQKFTVQNTFAIDQVEFYQEFDYNNRYLEISPFISYQLFQGLLALDVNLGFNYALALNYNTTQIIEAKVDQEVATAIYELTSFNLYGPHIGLHLRYPLANGSMVGLGTYVDIYSAPEDHNRVTNTGIKLNYYFKLK